MSLFNERKPLLITCGRGSAPFLARELSAVGFAVLAEHAYGIETEGTLADTMLLNLTLRTAQRVLYLVRELHVENVKEFYRAVHDIPWERSINPDGYISVTSVADTPLIANSQFLNLACKDAVVDRLFRQFNRRPDSGPEKNRTVLHCYWKDECCSLYFDTSGESLSRRGYRRVSVAAPLQESLAASLIMASSWNGKEHFINPMCGSGTFAIEAALFALEKAPGLLRNNFGLMHIKGFNMSDWRKLRNSFNRKVKTDTAIRIIATDIDEAALEAARNNARIAGVEEYIEFELCPFGDTTIPREGGLVVMNPEYGKRLGEEAALESVYRSIGDFLKQKCVGSRAAVFTGNLELGRHIGLRTSRKMVFFNGNIECRLLLYELYEGSKKIRK